MNLEDLCNSFSEYATHFEGRSRPTITITKQTIGLFCRTINVSELEQVTEDHVRRFFLVGRTERHWTANTYRIYLGSLRRFFRWCVKSGFTNFDPASNIESPRLDKRLPLKLSKQEASAILEFVEGCSSWTRFVRYRNHALMATMLFAGLRKSEVLNLRVHDIDLENMTLVVRHGKGARDRIVPICSALQISLARYATERRRANKACRDFFVSSCRDVGFRGGLRKVVDRIRKGTGIKFSPHKLRHTFATLMLEGGCDIYSLSKMMGHADIKTTTIYLAATLEHLRSQITKHPLNGIGGWQMWG